MKSYHYQVDTKHLLNRDDNKIIDEKNGDIIFENMAIGMPDVAILSQDTYFLVPELANVPNTIRYSYKK